MIVLKERYVYGVPDVYEVFCCVEDILPYSETYKSLCGRCIPSDDLCVEDIGYILDSMGAIYINEEGCFVNNSQQPIFRKEEEDSE